MLMRAWGGRSMWRNCRRVCTCTCKYTCTLEYILVMSICACVIHGVHGHT